MATCKVVFFGLATNALNVRFFFKQVVSEEPSSSRLPLTSSCCCCSCFLTLTDPLQIQPWSQDRRMIRHLLFIYFRVNTGVLYLLDYVEDIYITVVLSVLVSILNPNHMYLPLLLTVYCIALYTSKLCTTQSLCNIISLLLLSWVMVYYIVSGLF